MLQGMKKGNGRAQSGVKMHALFFIARATLQRRVVYRLYRLYIRPHGQRPTVEFSRTLSVAPAPEVFTYSPTLVPHYAWQDGRSVV